MLCHRLLLEGTSLGDVSGGGVRLRDDARFGRTASKAANDIATLTRYAPSPAMCRCTSGSRIVPTCTQ